MIMKKNLTVSATRRRINHALWATPLLTTAVLPVHAQTSPPITPPPDGMADSVNASPLRICVGRFNNPTDLSGANGSIELRITGDVQVSPPGLGDVVVSSFRAVIQFAEGTMITLHEPPETGSVTPDANGFASVDGLPLTTFLQEPIVPYINPANGQQFYPAVVTVTGTVTYGGVSDDFSTMGTVAATLDGAGSFTLSSPDTPFC